MDQQFQNNPINNSVPQDGPPENLPTEPVQEIQTPIMTEPTEPFIQKSIEPINTFPTQSVPVEPAPAYNPPVPDFSVPTPPIKEKRKGPSLLIMIIVILTVAIIIGLAFVFYYYATKSLNFSFNTSITPESVSTTNTTTTPVVENQPGVPVTPAVVPTSVIAFRAPDVLPTEQKSGNCWTSSLAQPNRDDTFRCAVGSVVYDPCFKTDQEDLVYCQMNPIADSGFVIKLTKALPVISLPETIQDNWAWFLILEDGTELSPYTGKRPSVDGEPAFYGSKIVDGERMVIIGGLTKGEVWTGQRKILIKEGTTWVTKSSDVVKIKTIWQ